FVVDTSVTANDGLSCAGNLQNIILRHVEVIGDGGDGDGYGAGANDGLYAGTGGSGHLFEYLYIHDQGRIHFYIRSDNTTIQYSWGERNESTPAQHAEGLYASRNDGITVKNLVIRYSVWKDEVGTGHTLCECDGWDVYGNLYWGV